MCSCADTLFESLIGGAVALVILVPVVLGALRVRRGNRLNNQTED